jgi:hypothetical protein
MSDFYTALSKQCGQFLISGQTSQTARSVNRLSPSKRHEQRQSSRSVDFHTWSMHYLIKFQLSPQLLCQN